MVAARVHEGKMTKAVKEQFTAITKRAFNEFVVERVQRKLSNALERVGNADLATSDELEQGESQSLVTTDQEIEAYHIVKAILREAVDAGRVFMRDTQSYCGVLLDDNNRKPICRLFLNSAQKRLVLFDGQRQPVRHAIQSVNDIYQHAEALKATALMYDRGGEMADVPPSTDA